MNIHFTEVSSLASIDNAFEDNSDISPAQYEIIRRVIYHTADFEYYSLLKFSSQALERGYKALKNKIPIVVDVPEIQVSIVPRLQQTFYNSVYCCATTSNKSSRTKTRAAFGLEEISSKHPESIFVIGQDRTTLEILIDLANKGIVNPRLAIATAPLFTESKIRSELKNAAFPTIYLDSKGGATVASAIFKALVELAWRADGCQRANK